MKRTFEMDLAEYEQSADFAKYTDAELNTIVWHDRRAAADILHRNDILSALYAGEMVPDNALLDYPDDYQEFERARIEGLYKMGRMVDKVDPPDYYALYAAFLKTMDPMQRGKAESVLSLDVRYGDTVTSRRRYVEMVHRGAPQDFEFNATQQRYYDYLKAKVKS
jgi:hypothetical protein